jgi:hypothetical protein
VRYTVVWTPTALGDLADAWARATDRNAVNRASDEIDRILRTDPDRQGSAFYGDRILGVPPLQAVFSVHPDDMLVRVEFLM